MLLFVTLSERRHFLFHFARVEFGKEIQGICCVVIQGGIGCFLRSKPLSDSDVSSKKKQKNKLSWTYVVKSRFTGLQHDIVTDDTITDIKKAKLTMLFHFHCIELLNFFALHIYKQTVKLQYLSHSFLFIYQHHTYPSNRQHVLCGLHLYDITSVFGRWLDLFCRFLADALVTIYPR